MYTIDTCIVNRYYISILVENTTHVRLRFCGGEYNVSARDLRPETVDTSSLVKRPAFECQKTYCIFQQKNRSVRVIAAHLQRKNLNHRYPFSKTAAVPTETMPTILLTVKMAGQKERQWTNTGRATIFFFYRYFISAINSP